ncbi:MAG: thiolase domain-containing protein [Thaumarchaeota archaeon]|nr:thiolase domain-containing protein [Nitrososphaerota archaeon]
MRRVAVVGVGSSRFGRRDDANLSELAFEAVKPAMDEAGVDSKDIGFASVGTVGTWYEEPLPAVVVAEYAGLNPTGLVRCEAACASGSGAFKVAHQSVASGESEIAMAIGVEKMTEVDTPTTIELIGRAGNYLWEFENVGITFAGYYALYASAHMAQYGTTEEQLAMVAVKNHKYGAMNPYAHFQKEITLEQALGSPFVAWPLRVYSCCPVSDGSAAIILASEQAAKKLTDTPVWVKAIGTASDTANLSKRPDYLGLRATMQASKQAYERAGVSPTDIDVAEVHDCFTIAEILAYEDLGFCEKGSGGRMIEDGETYIGGRVPINLDGGLKAKGHPLGATGCMMIAEVTRQLRGEAGKRQAPIKNGLGLAHNVGGTGHYCYVTILGRE